MNEPLRAAIEKRVKLYSIDLAYAARRQKVGTLDLEQQVFMKSMYQLLRTTLTDLQAEMPTKLDMDKPLKDNSLDGIIETAVLRSANASFNQAVQQQQAAFKKVLEGME